MKYEVELKFPVPEMAQLEERIRALDAEEQRTTRQVDRYYNHPQRDFAQTDEALRIRSIGNDHRITYKGPKIDDTTKTRREIEIALGSDRHTPEEFEQLMAVLGFRPALTVEKQRREFHAQWQGRRVSLMLDQVEGLGDYLELEVVALEAEIAEVRESLQELAQHLQLSGGERRSYLELLWEAEHCKET